MMTYKLKIKNALLILLISCSNLFAQPPNDAKTLLNEVSSKVRGYETIKIDFKYVLENTSEHVKQETRGDVIMQGDHYRLNILGMTRIFNGTTLYSISPEDEEITISNEDGRDENSITPSKMLSFYESGYTKKMDIIQNVKGRKIQYVKLTPIDTNSEIKHILLGIDMATKHIYNLIEIGGNSTKTTLTVNSFKTNEPLSKSLFTFDENKYKEYYINILD